MPNTFWPEFTILFIAALLGGLAIMPYALRLLKSSAQDKPLPMSIGKLTALSFLQTAVVSAVTVGIGLYLARLIGLGAPYIQALIVHTAPVEPVSKMFFASIVTGIIGGAILLAADLLFLPHLPQAFMDLAKKTSTWENFSASFYGGINEEILMRLFGFSIIAWLFTKIWHTPANLPTTAVLWSVNIIMALIFGLGHLPAVKKLAGRISGIVLARTLVLNAPIGLICGWLFWRYGIEAAVLAHFSADIVYHVIGTWVLRYKTR